MSLSLLELDGAADGERASRDLRLRLQFRLRW